LAQTRSSRRKLVLSAAVFPGKPPVVAGTRATKGIYRFHLLKAFLRKAADRTISGVDECME